MTCTDKRLKICTALLVCNLIFIWGNSLMSAEVSRAFSTLVKDILNLFLGSVSSGGAQQISGDGLLRKLAHFTEFASLGLLLGWLFGMLQKPWVYPFLCGALAACVDETIQMFVPERGPGILDVGIDTAGVLTGMILLYLGHTYFKRKQTKTFGG